MKKETPDNIDEIFRDKFSGFESEPFPDTKQKIFTDYYSRQTKSKRWNNAISANLLLNIGRHKYAVAAAIAGLTLFFIGVYLYSNHQKPDANVALNNIKNDHEINNYRPSAIAPTESKKKASGVDRVVKVVKKEEEVLPLTTRSNELMVSYKAEKEKQIYYLPDSSKVYLNINSELTFLPHFTDRERGVSMSGEIYFDVKKNKNKPFVIRTAVGMVEVLGTSFMIRSISDGREELFVESGTVLFSEKGNQEKNKVVLTAGMKALLTPGKPIQILKDWNSNELYWKTNKLIFNKTSLPDVIKDIEKVFGIKISISDPKIYNCHFTSRFDLPVSLEEVMATLALSLNGSYERKNKICILNSNGCK